VAQFAGPEAEERWSGRVQGALRLLADSGFGGERSRGWGRSGQPLFESGTLPDLVLPGNGAGAGGSGYWLLSMFSPAGEDAVDWSRGNYQVITRGGRVESAAGHGQRKKDLRMLAEGSVIFAGAEPRGGAPDVAPQGFPHPVFRAGFALGISLPAVGLP
jgi:CRISPR type III-A-associated RAMP protein Csm4